MEQMTLTPSRRMEGARAYDRAADAFGVVPSRPVAATRFESRPMDEPAMPEPTMQDMVRAIPGWAVVIAGGVVAALMGVMLGGALHI
jgi:hypothetical protein